MNLASEFANLLCFNLLKIEKLQENEWGASKAALFHLLLSAPEILMQTKPQQLAQERPSKNRIGAREVRAQFC